MIADWSFRRRCDHAKGLKAGRPAFSAPPRSTEQAYVLERAADAAEARAEFDLADSYATQAMDAYRAAKDSVGLERAAEIRGRASLGTTVTETDNARFEITL